jgi:hypothetical protein
LSAESPRSEFERSASARRVLEKKVHDRFFIEKGNRAFGFRERASGMKKE